MGYMSEGAIVGIVIGSVITAILVLALLIHFFRLWIRGPLRGSDNKKRLDGKVVAITGSNTGIGKETALDLAKRGASVILLCRNVEKAEKAAIDIRAKAPDCPSVKVYQLDLASLKSVRQCAQELLDTQQKIDILVNNAGIMMCPNWKTEDGFDMQFGTNHLGHFLLTELLLPLLHNSVSSGFQPRIVNVSSMAHCQGRIYWRDVNFDKKNNKYNRWTAYTQSKLANVMHARQLAKRLHQYGIYAFSLHPGVIHTDLYRHVYKTWYGCWTWPFHRCLIKSPFYGAQTTLYVCLEDTLLGFNGHYFSDCRHKRPSQRSLDDKACLKLWDLSERMTGLVSAQSEML